MRILYLSQYFPPEVGATQTRASVSMPEKKNPCSSV